MKLGLFILIPLLLRNGTALNECDRCKCCKGGATRCQHYNSTSDVCLDGCIDSYYGKRCAHACMNNCLNCSESQVCKRCSDGYYGNSCKKCLDICQTCSNEKSCTSCSDGYHGAYCDECPDNCVTCSGLNTCNSCKDGFYNGRLYDSDSYSNYSNCRHTCQANCTSCTSYDTCTECKRGFYNGEQNFNSTTRENNNCKQQCPIECKSCRSHHVCTECVDGKYNNISTNCSESCNKDCKGCTSYNNCTSCKSGKYGLSCQFDCGTGCDGDACDINNGSCICISNFQGDKCDECVDGKYGSECNISCPSGCTNNLCGVNGSCNSCKTGFFGSMCDECVPGKYGAECDMICPTNCQTNSCTRNGDCYSCMIGFSGDTCNECVPGKYGTDCDIPCPTGCENSSCKSNGDCYQCIPGFSGNRCGECEHGKYGSVCNISCFANCANNSCQRNGDCYSCMTRFTGTKCDTCIDGKYGDDCNEDCPETCISCTSETNCTACQHLHWGTRCQHCPSNCLNCSSNNTCSSCKPGLYGQICAEKCHKNCRDGSCDKISGHCILGCEDGFYDNMCDKECSPNCVRSKCDREYGECSHGCKTGFKGTSCSEAISLAGSSGDNKIVIIGAAAGGGLFVVIVVIVVVLLCRKRRMRDNSKSNDMAELNEKTDNTTMRYSAVIADSLPVEQTDIDVVYAVPNKPKKNKDTVQALNADTSTKTANNDTPQTIDNNAVDSSDYATSLHNEDNISKQNDNKPRIAAIAPFVYDNTAVRNSVAMTSILKTAMEFSEETELEIEEDIDSITTSSSNKSAALHTTEDDAADTYYNVTAVKKRKIALDKLPDFVAKKTQFDFIEEFEQLPPGLFKPCKDSQRRENLSKNRYKGIYPYDATRVQLKDCGSDYINASYIDGYNKRKAYIASIGPTYKYMGDMSAFWIMVWQEKVGKIVMLTKLDEGGLPKCDQYWPEKDFSLLYANIQVTCQSEETYADYTVRSFTVQRDSEKRSIFQVHFMAWPDKGTPDDVTSLIEFRQKVISIKTELEGPILVHCSAGIGRTGTYIALDSLTEEGEAEGGVDIFAFVRNMREQRVNMVQTSEQYQYLHRALVHTLTFDSKAVEASKFDEYMTVHTDGHFVKSFQKLQASVEQRSDDEKEAVMRNQALENKNRVGADIPGDRYRPRLYLDRKLGAIDYINAVYVNSYQTINRYLVAQTPLPDTVADFLTLIVQERVSCIVSMETPSDDNKTVGTYTATNKPVKIGTFTVKSEQTKSTDQYALQTLCISHKGNSGTEEFTIPHIQFTQWNDNKSIPEDPAKFVKFVKEVELKYVGNEAKGPILIHCLTGAEISGLFCVVSTLLEKTEIDHEISVVNTVRQIKHRRHMSIPDKVSKMRREHSAASKDQYQINTSTSSVTSV